MEFKIRIARKIKVLERGKIDSGAVNHFLWPGQLPLRVCLMVIMLLFSLGGLHAQVKVCSWNIQNFGKSKTDAEITFIAESVKNFDIVAIQEVVAGFGGPQAVARLSDVLNRKGGKWDYIISDPTESTPYATERYAFLWNTAKVTGSRKAWLERFYPEKIDREPFLMDFNYNGKQFTLVSFHAVPKDKQPETEIKYFRFLPSLYPDRNLIFLGDFNISESHTVFNPLKESGYKSALVGQKTTMKMSCTSTTCLASEFDNIFYNSTSVDPVDSGVIRIYQSFPDMATARSISDHIPIWMLFYPGNESGVGEGIISVN